MFSTLMMQKVTYGYPRAADVIMICARYAKILATKRKKIVTLLT